MKIIFLGNMCNNDCVMCSVKKYSGLDFIADKKEIFEQLHKDSNQLKVLEFTGGEPTEHPGIIDFFQKGRSEGYKVIRMSTNGRNFSDEEFTEKLVNLGLKSVDVALHGIERDHDEIVQKKGAFRESMEGIKNLQKYGVKIAVASVLIRQNIENLTELCEELQKMKIEAYSLLELVPQGRSSGSDFERFAIPYTEKKKFLYDNMKLFSNFDQFYLLNFTRCVLPVRLPEKWFHIGGYEKKFIGYTSNDDSLIYNEGAETSSLDPEDKIKNSFCPNCSLRNKCSGFSKFGLDLFGEEDVEEMMKTDNIGNILFS